MAKILHLTILVMVIVAANGLQDKKEYRRQKRMNDMQDVSKEEDLNKIDHGSKHSKPHKEFEDETVYPKKLAHKKKNGNKNRQEYPEEHTKLFGQRGEQRWKVRDQQEKRKKTKIDSLEDIHLQDLSYSGPTRKEEFGKQEMKKKHHKDKGDHLKSSTKEKKVKKDKEMKKKNNKKNKKQKKSQEYF